MDKSIFDEFRHGVLRRGGEVYFDRAAAAEFVSACERDGIAITGIEAFAITADATRPVSDHMADFTNIGEGEQWPQYRDASLREAREFVADIPAELFVTFGVADEARFESLRTLPSRRH